MDTELLRSKAEEGDVESCFRLAQALALGNEPGAIDWYMRAAKGGHQLSQIAIATCYRNGIEFEQDAFEALMWYFRAFASGSEEAFFEMEAVLKGMEYAPSEEEVLSYLEKASADDGSAMFALGRARDLGIGGFDPDAAYQCYSKAAEMGCRDGEPAMAICQLNGSGTPRDRQAAAAKLQELSDRGCPVAAMKLADCYEYGRGVPKDAPKALEIYQGLADRGYIPGMYSVGRCHMDGVGTEKDGVAAYCWYFLAATRGSRQGMYGLARCYMGGVGVDRLKEGGLYYLNKAAELGSTEAMVMLAQLYAKGKQVKEDRKASAMWFQKAADLGDEYAQYVTSENYATGNGVKKDAKKALQYARMSAAQGNTVACFEVGSALTKGPDRDDRKAFEWFSKAAEDNYMKAQFAVAEAYSKGRGVKKDPAKAFELHLKLAQNGFGKSQYHVAYAYFEGAGTEKDDKKAFEWFLKGAESGNALCQYYAGYCYTNGVGTRKDESKDLEMYRRAAEQGHIVSREIVERRTGESVELKEDESPFEGYLRKAKAGDTSAMFLVGRCYKDGVGTEVNLDEARKWFNKGAAAGHKLCRDYLHQMRIRSNRRPCKGAAILFSNLAWTARATSPTFKNIVWLRARRRKTVVARTDNGPPKATAVRGLS